MVQLGRLFAAGWRPVEHVGLAVTMGVDGPDRCLDAADRWLPERLTGAYVSTARRPCYLMSFPVLRTRCPSNLGGKLIDAKMTLDTKEVAGC